MKETIKMQYRNRASAAAIALTLAPALAACGGATTGAAANRSLYSVHQPIVATSTFALDLATAGGGGLSQPEQERLAGWLDTMRLAYGDRLTVEGPGLTPAARADVAAIAGRHGIIPSEAAPVSAGGIAPGSVRVTLTRSTAEVRDCPDWSGRPGGGTRAGYGCATNANLAAMISDPEHLLHGATDTGNTQVMTSNKAIDAYRNGPTTGAAGLSQVGTSKE